MNYNTFNAVKAIENYLLEKNEIISKTKKEYLLSLKKILEKSGHELVAIHGPCSDGVISGVLLKFLFPESTVIPIDYWFIKDEYLGEISEKLPWKAIGDLSPLNQSLIKELYFDHHRTSIGKTFNAEKVFFDANGESASSVLFDALKSKINFPQHFEKLVELTRITDTGNYPGDPPINPPKKVEKCSFDELVWLFDDATSSCKNAFEVIDLIDGYFKEGVEYLNNESIQERIKHYREERKEAWELGQKIENTDFLVFIVKDEQLDHRSLLRSILTRVNIGAASVVEELDHSARISLRIKKSYQKENKEWEKYRVDQLAKSMNGGGHMAASGAKTKTVQEAIEKISQWASEKGLNLIIADFRNIIE